MKPECLLCNELKKLSCDTWERIGFARSRKGFKIFETTITQNLLFELKKFSENCNDSQVQLFEAINEKANGNDIEVFLQVGDRYICLPTQAKILYNSSKYTAMDHGNQINDLISYSKKVGGFPLYLLYNYYEKEVFKKFGCSLVSADYLLNNYAFKRTAKSGKKRWIIPTFNDLHSAHALPWDELFCLVMEKISDLSIDLGDAFTIDLMRYEKLTYYSEEEIANDPNWKNLSLAKRDSITNYEEKENSEMADEGYMPGTRIVISNTDSKETN